jgi:hypothetical protein
MQMPSWACVKTEAVARGFRSADAPARCRGACFQRSRRTKQQQRQAGVDRGEMQLLAGFQIEPVDHADDGGRCSRTQSFGHRPQALFAVRGFDQNQPLWIETEIMEAVPMQAAVLPDPIGQHDKNERVAAGQARQNRRDKAERTRDRAFRLGHDFVQRAASQATFRQVGIQPRQTEGQGGAEALVSRQEPAQFRHHCRALRTYGKRS